MVFQSPLWSMIQDLTGTVLQAWSRFQLCTLVEVLRDSPCRHSCRQFSSQSLMCNELASCFALADATKDSPARGTEGFTTVALSKCGVPHDVDMSCQLCPSVSCE